MDNAENWPHGGWNWRWTRPSSCSGLETEEGSSPTDLPVVALGVWDAVEGVGSFKTASGENTAVEAPLHRSSGPESGRLCKFSARVTDAHKPLVSASRVTSRKTIAIRDSKGAAESPTARKIRKLTQREMCQRSGEGPPRLYTDPGVCNFLPSGQRACMTSVQFLTGAKQL